MYLHPDLHLHSTVSDGSDTPLELLEKIRKTDIDIFSLTDHDTYMGCGEIINNLRPGDPAFIGGIEISCKDEIGKYHILGYCYDINKPSIQKAVEATHKARRQKALNRIQYLEGLGFAFTEEEKQEILLNENPGKPHFVAMLMRKGYISDKKVGFGIMEGYRGSELKLRPEEAIDAILRADGIPVLAHGILDDGSKILSEDEIRERVVRLKAQGLMGLECYYSSYTPEQTAIMLKLAEENNLMVTAGSDYHGKAKTVALGASGGAEAEKMKRFYQAAKALALYVCSAEYNGDENNGQSIA